MEYYGVEFPGLLPVRKQYSVVDIIFIQVGCGGKVSTKARVWEQANLVSVVFWFVGSVSIQAKILGLYFSELGELNAEVVQMCQGYFFIQLQQRERSYCYGHR